MGVAGDGREDVRRDWRARLVEKVWVDGEAHVDESGEDRVPGL